MKGDNVDNTMKQHFERYEPTSGGVNLAVFLSQGQVKAETSDSRQFLDPNWLSKNYFE